MLIDFTEPQNSFALAINSPPSAKLAGAGVGGPQGDQVKVRRNLKCDEWEHYYLKAEAEDVGIGSYELRRRRGLNADAPVAPN